MREPIFPHYHSEVFERVDNREIGLRGYLVFDMTIDGLSCGGLRMHSDLSLGELQDLAHIMTLKQAFIGVRRGGARAGIVAPGDLPDERKQLLINCFGELIRHHLEHRNFLCGRDVGTTARQIQLMYQNVGMGDLVVPAQGTRSGYYTALSVLIAVQEALRLSGMALSGCTVAIEGFGKVGNALASLLAAGAAKVVAISTIDGALYDQRGLDIAELRSRSKDPGWMDRYPAAERIPKEHLLELPVDALCPCATESTINTRNMELIKAKVICAGANNPVTLAADRYLFSKGVLYLPDFVTNCGGVLGNAVDYVGLSKQHLVRLLQEEVASQLRRYVVAANNQGLTPREVAIDHMNHRLQCTRSGEKGRRSKKLGSAAALLLLRKGLIPTSIMRPFTYQQLRKRISA